MKPNFLVIGAQKCGTTSLCRLLSQHPRVFMPSDPEPHFFALDELFEERGWSWYESLFADAVGAAAIGEGSTSYTMNEHRSAPPERIASALPEAKLIYIVRDPLARIESNYLHLRKTLRTSADFTRTVEDNPYMIDTSLYWKQIGRYRDHFPDEQLLVLFFEDFVAAPTEILDRCFRFLDVEHGIDLRDAEAPRNRSLDEPFDNRLGVALRRLPGAAALSRALPSAWRSGLQKLTSSRLRERPIWEPEQRLRVLDTLRPDVERFLEYFGKSRDFWRLDAPDGARAATAADRAIEA